MRRHTLLAALALAVVSSGPLTATQTPAPRLMAVRDTQNFVAVGSPAISPDGQWVLYTRAVRDWDDAQLRTRTHIWRVKIDGTDARQLTFGAANTTSPSWLMVGRVGDGPGGQHEEVLRQPRSRCVAAMVTRWENACGGLE